MFKKVHLFGDWVWGFRVRKDFRDQASIRTRSGGVNRGHAVQVGIRF